MPSNGSGTYTFQFDFSTAMTNEFGWSDCQRVTTLEQASTTPNPGCPGCDYVMVLDSSAVTSNCDPDTGITDDPVTGIMFGVEVGDGELRFWNYQDEAWGTFIDTGSSTSSSYSGDTGWEADTYDPGEGTVYDYEFRSQVNLTWN